ncbi:glycosyltransferase [Roseibacillus persicicus]|uniref:glycosyltransferase n=1 Tax=Roseibacillus persicicus TaxID=454148 RepID=UPI00398A9FD8
MILQVFNRYREFGGEEFIVNWISKRCAGTIPMEELTWNTSDWDSPEGPGLFGQAIRVIYNWESADTFRRILRELQPSVILMHNIYPVGSPSLYRVAEQEKIPVIQYLHNYRPFSVGGSLWANGKVVDDALHGKLLKEVLSGAWQNSRLKSAIFALALRNLHRSGWLDSIKCWIAISDFVRDRFIEAGVPPERIITLRHAWDTIEQVPEQEEENYYLFLSRLVEEKGVRILLDAWKILAEELGGSCPKLKIGGVGPDRKLLLSFSKEHRFVEYLGFVEPARKSELIGSSRGLVAPSIWWEPSGLVTFEAYNLARPILASATGGLQENIIEGKTGFLFAPGSARNLADAVIKCEKIGKEGRSKMGQAGRGWLEEFARPEDWYRDFQRILDQVEG